MKDIDIQKGDTVLVEGSVMVVYEVGDRFYPEGAVVIACENKPVTVPLSSVVSIKLPQ